MCGLDGNFQKFSMKKLAWWEFACLSCNLIPLGNRNLTFTEFCLYQITIVSSLNFSGITFAPDDGGVEFSVDQAPLVCLISGVEF